MRPSVLQEDTAERERVERERRQKLRQRARDKERTAREAAERKASEREAHTRQEAEAKRQEEEAAVQRWGCLSREVVAPCWQLSAEQCLNLKEHPQHRRSYSCQPAQQQGSVSVLPLIAGD